MNESVFARHDTRVVRSDWYPVKSTDLRPPIHEAVKGCVSVYGL